MKLASLDDLIEQFRDAHGSDRKAGPALGVSQQVFSEWRRGADFPTEERVIAMARALGVDADVAVVLLRRDRAKSDEARSTWQRVFKALSRAACVAVVAGAAAAPSPADARVDGGGPVYYVKRSRRWLFPLFPDPESNDRLAL